MALAVQDLLQAPDLPLKLDAARRALDLEAAARADFRDRILPHEKGEFINGETLMHSPARESHNRISSLIVGILSPFVRSAGLGLLRYEKALCAFSRNDYEPDIVWFGPEKSVAIGSDTVVYPVPDLIVEILSPATESRDRGVKFDDYAAHGVGEYWIVDPDAQTLEQYLLDPGADTYRLAEKLAHGDVRPAAFPELSIPLAAFFQDDAHLAHLREILNRPNA